MIAVSSAYPDPDSAGNRTSLAVRLTRAWFRGDRWLWLLRPLGLLFGVVVAWRLANFRRHPPAPLPVPLWIVGNIVIGGSGKSPLTLWLVDWLRARGRRPGIISRGHGGHDPGPRLVQPDDDAARVGDEPLMLRLRSDAPVCIGRDRVAAARWLLEHTDVDWIVSDDGLQHHRLARDLEIITFDGERGAGNGWLLPAGPLREPVSRLTDALVVAIDRQVASLDVPQHVVRLRAGGFLDAAGRPVESVPERLLAVCGIGHPERFFQTLRALGHDVEGVALADHGDLDPADWVARASRADRMLVLTEKDAARCLRQLRELDPARVRVLRIELEVPDSLCQLLSFSFQRQCGVDRS